MGVIICHSLNALKRLSMNYLTLTGGHKKEDKETDEDEVWDEDEKFDEEEGSMKFEVKSLNES